MKIVAWLALVAELSWTVRVLWRRLLFPPKITVISYANLPLSQDLGYAHRPIRTRCIGRTPEPESQIIPKDTKNGTFLVYAADEGVTWCWGWKQEDVDALVVAYSLR